METENHKSAWLNEIQDSMASLDLASQFSNMHLWSSTDENIQATKAFLSLHGKNYFSPLRASFLFEHSSDTSLSHFSPLLARDGALNLLHFFYSKSPIPGSKILVPRELSHLVPTGWRQNCFAYKTSQSRSSSRKIKKLLLVISALGEKHCSEEQLQFLLEKHLSLLNLQNVEVFVSFVIPNVPDTFEQINKEASQALNNVLLLAKNFTQEIQTISIENVFGSNLEEWAFLDLNPLKFYYSNSYVHHSMMSRGALNLESQWNSQIEGALLSPFHAIQFTELLASAVDGDFEAFKSNPQIAAEENAHHPKKILFNTKICSASFEDFAYDLVRRS